MKCSRDSEDGAINSIQGLGCWKQFHFFVCLEEKVDLWKMSSSYTPLPDINLV